MRVWSSEVTLTHQPRLEPRQLRLPRLVRGVQLRDVNGGQTCAAEGEVHMQRPRKQGRNRRDAADRIAVVLQATELEHVEASHDPAGCRAGDGSEPYSCGPNTDDAGMYVYVCSRMKLTPSLREEA